MNPTIDESPWAVVYEVQASLASTQSEGIVSRARERVLDDLVEKLACGPITPAGLKSYCDAQIRNRRHLERRRYALIARDRDVLCPLHTSFSLDERVHAREAIRRMEGVLAAVDQGVLDAVLRGESHEVISRRLGLSASAVRLRVFRARERLARLNLR